MDISGFTGLLVGFRNPQIQSKRLRYDKGNTASAILAPYRKLSKNTMPKRYFKYYLTAITVISFIACSEKDTLNGEGMLHLKVGVTDQVKVTTRSMTDELQDSLQRHCTIGILNEKGTVRRYKGVNELPEALYLCRQLAPHVTAGDSVPASFETVYYKEERPFHINSGEVTNLELTCGIANTVVAVKYDEALSSVFQTYKVRYPLQTAL